jgi:hypothetical protein
MPQCWSSGVFWPRTGCVLDNGALNCSTGQCGGDTATLTGGRLDCGSVGSSPPQQGPTPPVALFEPTTTETVANYDVSLNNGYNVEMKVTAVGGSGSLCTYAGCLGDLNTAGQSTSCPANLVFKDPRGGSSGGCYQPLDACLSDGAGNPVTPPAGLNCNSAITTDALGHAPASTTMCNGVAGGPVTYLDMYEAKNTADSVANNKQATGNGGTPTAFSLADCLPGTEFTSSFVASGSCSTSADCKAGQTCKAGTCAVVPPPGMGVCLQFVSGILVPNWGCSASNIGASCGQYNGSPTNGLGYTCQAVTYSGGTAYPCVPPTLSGLGACNTSTDFYPGVGGVFNPSWVQAGIQAGGGTTPYYQTFKSACPAAYTWQYDDVSGGRACTFSGQPAEGFNIDFCASLLLAGGGGPSAITEASGKAQNVGTSKGNVTLSGRFTLAGGFLLDRATLTLGQLLDEVGGAGELAKGAGGSRLLPVTLQARSGSKPTEATYQTPSGVSPSVRVDVKSREPLIGLWEFSIKVDHATISSPTRCGGGSPATTRLATSFALKTTSDEVAVGATLPWQCRGSELKTP